MPNRLPCKGINEDFFVSVKRIKPLPAGDAIFEVIAVDDPKQKKGLAFVRDMMFFRANERSQNVVDPDGLRENYIVDLELIELDANIIALPVEMLKTFFPELLAHHCKRHYQLFKGVDEETIAETSVCEFKV